MKKRITRKKARAIFRRIFAVNYCALEFCGISGRDAGYYNAGGLGWNWDLIEIGNGCAVCTGYRNHVGECFPAEVSAIVDACRREWSDAFNGKGEYSERLKIETAAAEKARAAILDFVASI